MHSAKIAISLPQKTLQALEEVRRESGASRSSLVAEAIVFWLEARQGDPRDDLYVRGYLRQPERTSALEDLSKEIMAEWDPWE